MILLRLCLLASLLIFLIGCTSSQSSSPVLYGEHKEHAKETPKKDDTQKVDSTVAAETVTAIKAAPIEKETKDSKTETKTAFDNHKKSADNTAETKNDDFKWKTSEHSKVYYDVTDDDGSASAVDDDLWRQLDLANEYHSMGGDRQP